LHLKVAPLHAAFMTFGGPSATTFTGYLLVCMNAAAPPRQAGIIVIVNRFIASCHLYMSGSSLYVRPVLTLEEEPRLNVVCVSSRMSLCLALARSCVRSRALIRLLRPLQDNKPHIVEFRMDRTFKAAKLDF
jgi:hypothetical protein